MAEKKPIVFPNKASKDITPEPTNQTTFEAEKAQAVRELFVNSTTEQNRPSGEISAIDQMRRRTEEQMALKKQTGEIKYPELSETPTPMTRNDKEKADIMQKSEEQLRIRDEHP